MPYTAPTLEQFMNRFPELDSYTPEQISAVLDEAARGVDQNWHEADYQPAILYLAAHLLTFEGLGAGSGVIGSESLGPVSVSYVNGATQTGLGASEYGRRYRALLRRNVAGAAVLT